MHVNMNVISFFLNLKSTFKRYLKKIVKISKNLKKKIKMFRGRPPVAGSQKYIEKFGINSSGDPKKDVPIIKKKIKNYQ